MRNKIYLVLFFLIIPKGFISRIFGIITRIPFPGFIINPLIRIYCRLYKVNQTEIDYPDKGFRTFDLFFTRKLKPGLRNIDSDRDSVVSPVDAAVVQFGAINRYKIIQAKGIEYTIADLIPSESADNFMHGSFITLYLSPADYHRIHSPVEGRITGYYSIPGKLFPVQDFMVDNIKGIFTKNERVLTYIQNHKGNISVCMIGAMNVGRISLSYADIEMNKFIREKNEYFYPGKEQPFIKKGAELGIFHLGSTVILLFQKDKIIFDDIEINQRIRVGQRIARYI